VKEGAGGKEVGLSPISTLDLGDRSPWRGEARRSSCHMHVLVLHLYSTHVRYVETAIALELVRTRVRMPASLNMHMLINMLSVKGVLLPLSGGIAIRRVCLFVGSFVSSPPAAMVGGQWAGLR